MKVNSSIELRSAERYASTRHVPIERKQASNDMKISVSSKQSTESHYKCPLYQQNRLKSSKTIKELENIFS